MGEKQIVSVRLDPGTLERLHKLAEQCRCTISDLMRQAATVVIEANQPVMTFTWLTMPAVAAGTSATFVASEPPDVELNIHAACLHQAKKLTDRVAELEAKLAEAERERDRFREHSVWLNTIGFKAAEALGRIPEGADAVQGNPIADVEKLIRERDSLGRRCAVRFGEREEARAEAAQHRDEIARLWPVVEAAKAVVGGLRLLLAIGRPVTGNSQALIAAVDALADSSGQALAAGTGETGPDVEASAPDEFGDRWCCEPCKRLAQAANPMRSYCDLCGASKTRDCACGRFLCDGCECYCADSRAGQTGEEVGRG